MCSVSFETFVIVSFETNEIGRVVFADLQFARRLQGKRAPSERLLA